MASYLNPQPSNAILDDIINIRELENYNAQSDPSLGSDFPTGAKRFINIGTATAPKWQWQRYDGTSWQVMANTATEKLMHNVDMLDGYHASTSAVANSIPVYNADKLLVGGITGNAATATKLKTARNLQVGGIASGDAKSFNGTAAVTLPINSINVNNAEDDAIVGVLTAKHGGTGRTDGAAQDVRVSSIAGEVSAKTYGQIGQTAGLTASTDLNSLTVDGCYCSVGKISATVDKNFPSSGSIVVIVFVRSSSPVIYQVCHYEDSQIWVRHSIDKGATWTGWTPKGSTKASNVLIYISKSGSDSNTGLSNADPVLTFSRALQIARNLQHLNSNGETAFCFGEGNWGTITMYQFPFRFVITNYRNAALTQDDASELPKFDQISIAGTWGSVRSVEIGLLDANIRGYIQITGGFSRIGRFRARYNGTIEFNNGSNGIEVTNAGASLLADAVVRAYRYGHLICATSAIKLIVSENLNFSDGGFLYLTSGGTFDDAGMKVEVKDGVTVTTHSCSLWMNTFYFGGGDPSRYPGSLGPTIGDGAYINGVLHDPNLVLRTGNQTIGGVKTFESSLFVTGASTTAINISNNTFTRGDEITSTQYHQFNLLDKAKVNDVKHRFGSLEWGITNTAVTAYLRAYKNVTNVSTNAFISVVCPTEGATYATAPTTPDGSTDNKIVTADWLHERGLAENLVAKANQDANTYLKSGFYWLSSTATNIPSGINGLLVVYALTSVVRQVFYRQGTIDSNDYAIFTRQLGSFVNGVPTRIGNWVQILTGRGGTIKDTLPRLHFMDTDITRNTLTGAEHGLGMTFKDSAGSVIGELLYHVYANGGAKIEMSAYNFMGSGEAALGVAYGAEKGPYGYAPTPLATSNTNDIATTAWVRARSKWTYAHKVLVEASHAEGEYTLDFSSYLPNDGEDYEVLLNIYCSTSTDTTTNSVLVVYTPGNTRYIQVEAEGKNFEQNTNTALLPVSSTRTIRYTVTNYSFEKITFRVAGYRKA